jgi:ATP-dependent helicase/nuclease subunit A
MTRAAERLIVCGAEGERGRPKGCWYDLIREALQPALVEARDGEEKIWRYRKPADDDSDDNSLPASAARAVRGKIPVWLRSNAPIESPCAMPLSPSAAYDEAVAARPDRAVSVADRRKALARGRLVHRLMQSLPDIAPVHRGAAAQNFLARTAADFTAEEQEQIATQILGILADARFAALFAPGSRAEVSIVGRIARGGDFIAVAGQVDRLVVTDEAVLIADYKTNRDAPRRTEDVPPDYVAQLALYRAVLAQLYPGKPVRAALIWTDVPDLMEISPDNLDVALVEVMRRHAG